MNHLFQLQPNFFLRKLYPKAIWNGERNKKCIYLTFDDGPIAGLSEWVLDELKYFNAKATFFCVGENILKEKAIFERIKNEGHLVANHTMRHVKGFKNTIANYLVEADNCRELTNNYYFRPPYGQLKIGQYKSLINKGYKIVFWDVISYDYENISGEMCVKNVLKHTENGSIILFHDSKRAEKNLKYTLPVFLKHFSENGFEFKSMAEDF